MWKYIINTRVLYICDYCNWDRCTGRNAIDKYRNTIQLEVAKLIFCTNTCLVSCDYGARNEVRSVIAVSTKPAAQLQDRNDFLHVFDEDYTDKIIIPIGEHSRFSVIPYHITYDIDKFITDNFGTFGPHNRRMCNI